MQDKYWLGLIAIAAISLLVGIFLFPNNSEPLLEKNCGWENVNQELYSGTVYRDVGGELSKGGFMAPLGISYEDVEFIEFGVLATNTENDNRFILNGISCGSLKQESFAFNDLSAGCLDALKEGINEFNISVSRRDVIVHEIYLGLRYRPANCL